MQHAVIGGIPIARLSFGETLALLEAWLGEPGSRRVATANLDFLALAGRDAELRRALVSAELVTADGMVVVWLSRLAGTAAPERVTGADLVPALLASAARLGTTVFFLGGPPGVAERASIRSRTLHPTLHVVGVDAPLIRVEDDATCREVAARIRATGAQLLLVGLGCPKQEIFLERYLAQCGCRVGIGIGGAFSFLAGEQPRAPRLLQLAGLEWLFRLVLEPRRLSGRYARDLVYLARELPRVAWARIRRAPAGGTPPLAQR